MSDDPDVEADGVALLRRRADGEGVPLERRDARNLDKNIFVKLRQGSGKERQGMVKGER